jgi:hypothetical protein
VRGVAAHLFERLGFSCMLPGNANAPSLVKLTVVGCRLMKIAEARS